MSLHYTLSQQKLSRKQFLQISLLFVLGFVLFGSFKKSAEQRIAALAGGYGYGSYGFSNY